MFNLIYNINLLRTTRLLEVVSSKNNSSVALYAEAVNNQ